MDSATRLIVVRHGNTFNSGDVILRVGARTDIPLTARGREQGREVAQRLVERGLRPDAYFYAPLQRTRETCEEIASAFQEKAPASALDFLTELDYGEDDGRPEEEVLEKLGGCEPNAPTDKVERASLGKTALRRWDAEAVLPVRWRFLEARAARLPQDWREFAAQTLSERRGQTTLAVTSNGIARFALEILPKEAPRPESLKLGTGKFGIFLWDAARSEWTLEAWNV